MRPDTLCVSSIKTAIFQQTAFKNLSVLNFAQNILMFLFSLT